MYYYIFYIFILHFLLYDILFIDIDIFYLCIPMNFPFPGSHDVVVTPGPASYGPVPFTAPTVPARPRTTSTPRRWGPSKNAGF